ncbi:MAG TPA: nucleotidyltransferase domain-containing protein [Bacteroidia bacterium]|nr:nucleotidyltransferase domain-containing protein [Bacteroidia bacterium]
MISLVSQHKEEIKQICERHHVHQLFLFGSAANGQHRADSDLDFLVYFDETIDLLNYADNFFALMEELKSLLHREVDLLTGASLKNSILKEEIDRTKIMLYAA